MNLEDTVVISPDEIQELHPLIDTSEVECGIYTQHDGYIDPTMLTTAVAKEAKVRRNRKIKTFLVYIHTWVHHHRGCRGC